MEKENIHSDHRKRLKEIYLKKGLDSFSDIQILEFLLTFSIPRKNTNPAAHAILKEFKTINAVFHADPKKLELIEGVGPNSAMLIKLVMDINKVLQTESVRKGVLFGTPEDAKEYVKGFFSNINREEFYAFFLNKGNRLLGWEKLADGSPDRVTVDIRNLMEAALKYATCKIILAHNHPGGNAAPSSADKATTRLFSNALSLVGIDLRDHIIVTDDDAFSFEDCNLFKEDDAEENKIQR